MITVYSYYRIREDFRIWEREKERDRETEWEANGDRDAEDKREEASSTHPPICPSIGEAKAARRSRERQRQEQVWDRERNRGKQTPYLQVWQSAENLCSKNCKRNKTGKQQPGPSVSCRAHCPAGFTEPLCRAPCSPDGDEQPAFVLFSLATEQMNRGSQHNSLSDVDYWFRREPGSQKPHQRDGEKVWRESRSLWFGWCAD